MNHWKRICFWVLTLTLCDQCGSSTLVAGLLLLKQNDGLEFNKKSIKQGFHVYGSPTSFYLQEGAQQRDP